MEENLLAHVLIRRLIARRGLARSLPPAEVSYLLSMESEKYRQAIAAAPPQHPPDPKGFVLQPPCA